MEDVSYKVLKAVRAFLVLGYWLSKQLRDSLSLSLSRH